MRYLTLILTILASAVFSQDSVWMKYTGTITADELSGHVHKLASPAFEGRNTGSEGIRQAAEYIRRAYKSDGLKSGVTESMQPYFQDFTLEKCYWSDQHLTHDEVAFKPDEDFIFLGDPADISGEYPVIFAGYGLDETSWSDYASIDVKGKIVMAFSGEPKDQSGNYILSGDKEPSRRGYYFSKMRVARQKGAVGLIIVSKKEKDYEKYTKSREDYRSRADIHYPGDGDTDNFFTLYMNPSSASKVIGISEGKLTKAPGKMDKEQMTLAGKYEGELEVSAGRECFPMNSENVIGMIEGTDLKNEAVVVVAHYDHLGKRGDRVYFGADDNASGTASLMEIAEAFALAAKDGIRPRRTVIFLAVAGEELGLLGSRFYSEHPVISLDSTVACVNIDMIGRADSKREKIPGYIGGMAYNSEDILETAKQSAAETAPGLDFQMTYRERVSGGSDHYYFAQHGIPSLFYFTGIHKDYHEPTDTADKLLYDRMEMTVRSIFLTVWELAND